MICSHKLLLFLLYSHFSCISAVTRGYVVGKHTYPWMAYIVDINLGFCGGFLIHPRYILTAAHCIQCKTVDEVGVILGRHDLQNKSLLEIDDILYLSSIKIHPEYNASINLMDENTCDKETTWERIKNYPDIALLQLEKKVEIGPTINTISLPPNPSSLYEGHTMIVSGWGKTGEGNNLTSQKLLATNTKVYPNKECKKIYEFLKR